MNKPPPNDKDLMQQREALKKLAKLSVYTAPTVTTLLASELSYAQGSPCANAMGNLQPDTGGMSDDGLGASADIASMDQSMGANDLTQDCGI